MIAAWLPYFHLVRFVGLRPFDGDSAGVGPGPSGPDEGPAESEGRATPAGNGHGTGNGSGSNNNNEPNGRASHLQTGQAKDNEPGAQEDSRGDANEEDSAQAAKKAEAEPPPGPSMDEEAFKDELTEHLDSMYRLALSLSKNPRDAEDLTQEATLKALNHWRQYKPGTNMRAWLLAIVRNAFINRYRRQRNRPGSVEFDDVEPFLSDTSNNGEGRHLSVRDIDQLSRLGELLDDEVKKALDELSDDFRETFLLAVVEELSYKDIAQILGVPVGTVMSRLFRARKQMQAKLSGYAHEAGWLQPEATTQQQQEEAADAEANPTDEAPSEAEESGVIES